MRKCIVSIIILGIMTMPSLASGSSASRTSKQGRPPETWDHEPGPGDRLDRFQIIYVDNHSCPEGQIEKFTAGSKQLNVGSSRECVSR